MMVVETSCDTVISDQRRPTAGQEGAQTPIPPPALDTRGGIFVGKSLSRKERDELRRQAFDLEHGLVTSSYRYSVKPRPWGGFGKGSLRRI